MSKPSPLSATQSTTCAPSRWHRDRDDGAGRPGLNLTALTRRLASASGGPRARRVTSHRQVRCHAGARRPRLAGQLCEQLDPAAGTRATARAPPGRCSMREYWSRSSIRPRHLRPAEARIRDRKSRPVSSRRSPKSSSSASAKPSIPRRGALRSWDTVCVKASSSWLALEGPGALRDALLELGGLARHLLVQPRLRDGDRELRGHFLRDGDLLRRELRLVAAEADRADEVAANDHRHHHVHVHARGEERLRLRGRREPVHVHDLGLAPAQAGQVPGQAQRIANAGSEVHAVAAHRSEPLHLPGVPVEQVDDGAGHAQQVAQPPEHRLGDRDRRGLGDDRAIDLVQDAQTLAVLGQLVLGACVRQGDRGVIGERLQQRDLAGGEGPGRGVADREHADHLAADAQRHREPGHDAGSLVASPHLVAESRSARRSGSRPSTAGGPRRPRDPRGRSPPARRRGATRYCRARPPSAIAPRLPSGRKSRMAELGTARRPSTLDAMRSPTAATSSVSLTSRATRASSSLSQRCRASAASRRACSSASAIWSARRSAGPSRAR